MTKLSYVATAAINHYANEVHKLAPNQDLVKRIVDDVASSVDKGLRPMSDRDLYLVTDSSLDKYITVENYMKHYEIYLVENGNVSVIPYELYDSADIDENGKLCTIWADHCLNPNAYKRICKIFDVEVSDIVHAFLFEMYLTQIMDLDPDF